MNTPRVKLTDALLKEALTHRASGTNSSAELVGDVLAAVETSPQGRGWSWQLAPQQRLLAIVLVTALLLSALVGFTIVAGQIRAPAQGAGDIAYLVANHGWTDGEGWIADHPRIFLVTSDRGDPTLLVDMPGAERLRLVEEHRPGIPTRTGPDPRWSPDGTRIAFRVFHDAPGIYIVDRDGSDLTRLTNLPEERGYWPDGGFEWSPDGTQIAFVYREYGVEPSAIFLVDTEDGRLTRLTDRRATRAAAGSDLLGHGWLDATSFAWSPDGSRIAFVQADNGATTGLYVINRDGTGERRLTEADLQGGPAYGYWHAGLAWSPDGSRIAFVRSPYGVETMFVINADGSGLREVAGPWLGPEGPTQVLAWSPDGNLIGGTRTAPGGYEIFVVNADGSGERVLGEGDHFDWSPDGSRLVFSDMNRFLRQQAMPATPGIYVINADGTGRKRLADGAYPAWSPVDR